MIILLPIPPSMTREEFEALLKSVKIHVLGCEYNNDGAFLMIDVSDPVKVLTPPQI